MEGGKKEEVSLRRFLVDQKIVSSLKKKCVLGHPIARANGPPKISLKLAV